MLMRDTHKEEGKRLDMTLQIEVLQMILYNILSIIEMLLLIQLVLLLFGYYFYCLSLSPLLFLSFTQFQTSWHFVALSPETENRDPSPQAGSHP